MLADEIGFVNFSMTNFGQPDCEDVCPVFQKYASDGGKEALKREIWLGSTISAVNEAIMTATAAGSLEGVYVESAPDDSVAVAYGLRSGDVIREINGGDIDSAADFFRLYEAVGDGENVRLSVIRNSQVTELSFVKVF
jgi:C-terminal processing protease CtpA/Prc